MFSDEKLCFETVVSDHIRNTFIKNNESVVVSVDSRLITKVKQQSTSLGLT